MTAPDRLKITGPEDVLGFIPYSLGYWPENSLVAMTMQGKRLGATLRVDLPEPGGGPGGGAGGGRNAPGTGRGGDPAAGGRGSAGPQRRSRSARRAALAGYARNVVSYLQADDAADGSLLAIFTDTDINSPADGTAWAELLRELESALEAAGLPLRDAWIVGAEFWRSAHCSDPACCAPPGRPVEQIRNSRISAEMVFRGSSVGTAPGVEDAVRSPRQADPAVLAAETGWMEQFSRRLRSRAQFAQVLDLWTMVLQAATVREQTSLPAPDGLAPDRLAPDKRAQGTPVPGRRGPAPGGPRPERATDSDPDCDAAGGPLELSPELVGYLRASLRVSAWRDAVLVMAAAGRQAAERGAEDFGMFDMEAGPAVLPGSWALVRPGPSPASPAIPSASASADPEAGADCAVPGRIAVPGYGEVLLGLAPSVPDWTRMGALETVLELVGRLGDGESAAAAATARGWIEWCRGRGSYADALYRQALRERPGYRLAELLAELGRRGTLCGWAARREAAWQKFAPDAA